MIGNVRHPFAHTVDIFEDKYAESLDKIFTYNKLFRGVRKITVFGEYFGENSFAGLHSPQDEKDILIFDVFLERKGFLPPKDFIDTFSEVGIPKLVYQGYLTEEFIKQVRHNMFNLCEGVVCKGTDNKQQWMVKIKTIEWLNKVKEKYGQKRIEEEFDGKVPDFMF